MKSFKNVSFTICDGITGQGIEILLSSSSKTLSMLYLCRLRITEDNLINIIPSIPSVRDIHLDIYPGITIDIMLIISRYSLKINHGSLKV